MVNYYLAVDIGASSGRHMLAHLEDGKVVLEEIHRFSNGMIEVDGHKRWDIEELFRQIIIGLKKCKGIGKIPTSMGIDTWAVDYVLLDENDNVVRPCFGYRDSRTAGMDEEVYKIIPEDKLYERTGIQKAIFNTIYQLMADKKDGYLDRAKSFLMVPDYLHYLLTSVKSNEYTNCSTTQLLNPDTKEWDYELIEMFGFNKSLFGEIKQPGACIGTFSDSVKAEVGFDCKVVLPPTHDTASAVFAVPNTADNVLYISSGTWSLLGSENMKAICTKEAMEANFTNEGGYEGHFRFLKNIMGLWMIQSVRNELIAAGQEYSFAELCNLAEQADIDSIVDANAEVFLAPASMIDAVKDYCKNQGQKVPETPGELAKVIYQSLAVCYKMACYEVEKITGKYFNIINVVGGGSKAGYLNKLTAETTGKTVIAGPSEATALGNIGAQMMAAGEVAGLKEFRNILMSDI
ncbi:rhamnulokinase [Pseudobutyrivibrio xylanivorans]|uniref:Rhamnulokinase n=1 Tax=Pseudobutyrivibrio xylanivorans DSM 14809 TaxID=1123012 RepID=A0A1M6BQI8_PSEXY|nr:rhamnulokinase [Pseudobutyrivibrio xylanivorans]SHI50977.1 rhamnulokinase [Pseudobutyrivibrio xylanivorans DSM 14809]